MGTAAADWDQESIRGFDAGLRGRLLRPGDEGYDLARRHYNALVDKHPALIVQYAGVGDVIKAVTFARTHHIVVAVRGGGHNVAGRALVDGDMVIDLSPMKGVRVDRARRTVRAEGSESRGTRGDTAATRATRRSSVAPRRRSWGRARSRLP